MCIRDRLYRTEYPCDGLHCIQMARCAKGCLGNQQGSSQHRLGNCYHADWSSSMSRAGWSRCLPGYFVQAIYRTDCHQLYCLQAAKCCEVEGSEWGECSHADWREGWQHEGWSSTSESDAFITGFFRQANENPLLNDGISNILLAAQCKIQSQPSPAVCGNGILETPFEQCDDGNQNSNDGCSGACTLEPGWQCQEAANDPLLVTEIASSTDSQCALLAGGLGPGKKFYSDEGFKLGQTPKELDGAVTVMTADSDKVTSGRTLRFKVNQEVRVYLLVDSQDAGGQVDNQPPSWMAGSFARTQHTISVDGKGGFAEMAVFRSTGTYIDAVLIGPAPRMAANYVVVVQRALCSEIVRYHKDGVRLVGMVSYWALEASMDHSHDSTDHSHDSMDHSHGNAGQVCDDDEHVCSYQEATVYGVMKGLNLGGNTAWIVGGYPDTGPNRRSVWSDAQQAKGQTNGQTNGQCSLTKAPLWIGKFEQYNGRVECREKGHRAPVACCLDQSHGHADPSVQLGAAMSYTELGSSLDRDWTGAAVCGTSSHVCNFAEATVYGAGLGHEFNGNSKQPVWIVGQLSSWDAHRRSVWNGQDSVWCSSGRYPAWWGLRGKYHGTVQCVAGTTVLRVSCCADRLELSPAHSARLVKTVKPILNWPPVSAPGSGSGSGQQCGPGWHLCNYQEVMVYGGYHHVTLQEPAFIVAGSSASEEDTRSVWNGVDKAQCKQHRAPAWQSGRAGPYYGAVECQPILGELATVACCTDHGFPPNGLGELDVLNLAELTSSSGTDKAEAAAALAALVDGVRGWTAEGGWAVVNPTGAWFKVEFGSVVEIVRVVFYNWNKPKGSDVNKFKFESSTDNVVWSTVLENHLTDQAGAELNPGQPFGLVRAGKWWRFTILSVWNPSVGLESGLSEMEMWQQGGGTELDLFYSGFKDRALTEDVYSSVTDSTRHQCASRCAAAGECLSFSWDPRSSPGTCTLSSANQNSAQGTITQEGAEYWEKRGQPRTSGYCHDRATDYRGMTSVTKSGSRCQPWTQQFPHPHSFTPTNWPGTGLGHHNYCRNPDGKEQGAWCLSMDTAKLWEPCDISLDAHCPDKHLAPSIHGGPVGMTASAGRGLISARIESLLNGHPMNVYLELVHTRLGNAGWGVGMRRGSFDLWFCYGRVGTMAKNRCALKIDPTGVVHVLGYSVFYSREIVHQVPDDTATARQRASTLTEHETLIETQEASVPHPIPHPAGFEARLGETTGSTSTGSVSAQTGSSSAIEGSDEAHKEQGDRVGGKGPQEPAASWWSISGNEPDAGIRLEARESGEAAMLEFRNAGRDAGWGIGATGDKLEVSYGALGTMAGKAVTALTLTDGNNGLTTSSSQLQFHKGVVFYFPPEFKSAPKLRPGSLVALKGGRTGQRWMCRFSSGDERVRCTAGDATEGDAGLAVVDAGNQQVALRHGSQYCGANDLSTGYLVCNHLKITPATTFSVQPTGPEVGLVSLMVGDKFCADDTNGIRCDRDRVGTGEKFGVVCLEGCDLVDSWQREKAHSTPNLRQKANTDLGESIPNPTTSSPLLDPKSGHKREGEREREGEGEREREHEAADGVEGMATKRTERPNRPREAASTSSSPSTTSLDHIITDGKHEHELGATEPRMDASEGVDVSEGEGEDASASLERAWAGAEDGSTGFQDEAQGEEQRGLLEAWMAAEGSTTVVTDDAHGSKAESADVKALKLKVPSLKNHGQDGDGEEGLGGGDGEGEGGLGEALTRAWVSAEMRSNPNPSPEAGDGTESGADGGFERDVVDGDADGELERAWLLSENGQTLAAREHTSTAREETLAASDTFKVEATHLRGRSLLNADPEPEREGEGEASEFGSRSWIRDGGEIATYYSTDSHASVQLRSNTAAQVYLELRTRGSEGTVPWRIDVASQATQALRIGTIAQGDDRATLELTPGGTVKVHAESAIFNGAVQHLYADASGMQCVHGSTAQGTAGRWSGWSHCPTEAYSVLGVAELHTVSAESGASLDQYQCTDAGCRARCLGTGCTVVARCCRTLTSTLQCRASSESSCPPQFQATGFTSLVVSTQSQGSTDPQPNQPALTLTELECQSGTCKARCSGSWDCVTESRCCRPQNREHVLECLHGSRGYGAAGGWGSWSSCSFGYVPVTVGRVSMLGSTSSSVMAVAKQQCNSEMGCRSWCTGAACHTWAQCCRVVPLN
eukprot:TRINITY_DN14936_c0_g1_i23.p1 TRINITY_DN14936_c0_g1~~TRINITY_DN14936_c0_g1_i23.p1  ORF type:complete len:2190 (-),score=358.91 TRINITY_DN14936_c0_g1_i23:183-6752(-)